MSSGHSWASVVASGSPKPNTTRSSFVLLARSYASSPRSQRVKQAAKNLFQKTLKRPFLFLVTKGIVIFCSLYNGYLYGLSFLFIVAS